jgi:hypothetical protein
MKKLKMTNKRRTKFKMMLIYFPMLAGAIFWYNCFLTTLNPLKLLKVIKIEENKLSSKKGLKMMKYENIMNAV